MSPAQGSSPPARGAQLDVWQSFGRYGIIPACAGSTFKRGKPFRQYEDHPRLRGEHVDYAIAHGAVAGSSPPARGARTKGAGKRPASGIIPACAGSTLIETHNPRLLQDHPRLRGEHRPRTQARHLPPGSSPPARGALPAVRVEPRTTGIIPACAGSTSGVSCR